MLSVLGRWFCCCILFVYCNSHCVGNCSVFCCTLLCVHCGIAIILMGKRWLVALLNLSSWYLVVVWGFLHFVIVVFPDHTRLLFFLIKTTVKKTV